MMGKIGRLGSRLSSSSFSSSSISLSTQRNPFNLWTWRRESISRQYFTTTSTSTSTSWRAYPPNLTPKSSSSFSSLLPSTLVSFSSHPSASLKEFRRSMMMTIYPQSPNVELISERFRGMMLIFFGTGSDHPTQERSVGGLYIQLNANGLLFDPGDGASHRLSRLGVDKIFLTEFKPDKCLGIPAIVAMMAHKDKEREKRGITDVRKEFVIGPPGTSSFLENTLTDTIARRYKNPYIALDLNFEQDKQMIIGETGRNSIGISVDGFHLGYNSWGYSIKELPYKRSVELEKLEALGIPAGPWISQLKKGEEVTIDGRKITPEDLLGEARRSRKCTILPRTLYSDPSFHPKAIRLARNSDVLVMKLPPVRQYLEETDKVISFLVNIFKVSESKLLVVTGLGVQWNPTTKQDESISTKELVEGLEKGLGGSQRFIVASDLLAVNLGLYSSVDPGTLKLELFDVSQSLSSSSSSSESQET